MIIKTFVEPPIDNNNYLIIDEESKEAALIDCSNYDNAIFEELKNQGATLKYILLTHGHFDHIAGIRNNPEVKVVMHQNDLERLEESNNYITMFGMPMITIPTVDIFIKNNDVIKLGNTEIKAIHTPGHTEGGICYYVDGILFSGDTLFKEAVGRCDLPGGVFNQIVESIQKKLFVLPEDTIVYPGHGKNSTIRWEKEHNRFL